MAAPGAGLDVLFAPASGEGVGGGHVMRCLALASAIVERGGRTIFAVGPQGPHIVERFAEAPVACAALPPGDEVQALRTLLQHRRPQALIVDNYAVGAVQEQAWRDLAPVLMIIDDLADRPHLADLLLDSGHGRVRADYATRVSAGCELLLGPKFALLRSGFSRAASERPAAIADSVERVFVSFGLSDVGGVTAAAVRVLRPLAPGAVFEAAISGAAQSLPVLRRMASADPQLRLHVDVREVAELMRGCDLAVGAGGSMTWERCSLALPSLAVIVADNQRDLQRRLARDGAVVAVELEGPGFEQRLAAAFLELRSPSRRAALRAASRALCDGRGAARCADALETAIRRSVPAG